MKPILKKQWNEPVLIRLIRSDSEESVLVGCKTAAALGTGPVNDQLACINPRGSCVGCDISAPS
jgi:hypothetical protein